VADFGHNVLPIITRLSINGSITDNIHLLKCEFKLIRLWDNANFIYNCHTFTCDLPLLSIHSTIHLVHFARRLIFVLSRADLIHTKPEWRNLSFITVNCSHSSSADSGLFFRAWIYVVTINKLTTSTTTGLTRTICNQSQYIT